MHNRTRLRIVRIAAAITVRLIRWQLRRARVDWIAPDGTAIKTHGRLKDAYYDLDEAGLGFGVLIEFVGGAITPGKDGQKSLSLSRRAFDYRRVRNVGTHHFLVED